MKVISIQDNIGIPKYRQIIGSVENAIVENKLKKDDRLPSINKVSLEFGLSRDTVLKAYEELKKRGLVYAILNKGYYVKSTEISIRQKIFLLFDELNGFKEDLYNSFLEHIGENVQVDIFFHHFDRLLFRKLINDNNGNYNKYVIMPSNLAEAATIKTLPANDVYILDQTNPDLSDFPAVYQNFIKDIYDALIEGKPQLQKYKKLILIFSGYREPLGMKKGFEHFCADFGFDHEITATWNERELESGDVYIIPNDRDLVRIIEKSQVQNLVLGKDFGIISYNESPLKRIAGNGITTISTDFTAMGKVMAQMILEGKKAQVENEHTLIVRNSL